MSQQNKMTRDEAEKLTIHAIVDRLLENREVSWGDHVDLELLKKNDYVILTVKEIYLLNRLIGQFFISPTKTGQPGYHV